MKEFWQAYGKDILMAILTLSELALGLWGIFTLKGGKDIDKDGKPDVKPKFNRYYIEVNGKKIYLEEMEFKKEETK